MPTNLPPEYFSAEKRYKEAATPSDKVSALEDLIAKVPKHKGTDKLRADLRKKLSQLREDAAKRKKSGKGDLYSVEKQGAAQAVLLGFPNSGKSSILATLTNAHPVIADFPMSTVMPLSGMMPYEDIQYQLVDLPPLGNESSDGWVSGIARNSDILLLVTDLSEDSDVQAEMLLEQIKEWQVPVLKKGAEYDTNGTAKPVIITANKSDLPGSEQSLFRLQAALGGTFPVEGLSTKDKTGIEDLRRTIFVNSRIIRVYSKEPGKKPDLATPFTLPERSTVLDLAEMIHKDFLHNLNYACIWGSAKFDGQRVQKDYILKDRDIVEFHLK